MSYDLYLLPPAGKVLSSKDFQGYFQNRPNYKLTGSDAFYLNEATGVYFTFVFSEGELPEEDAGESDFSVESEVDSLTKPHILFNLNYYRPHTFCLEASFELNACVVHFALEVDDPQLNGMGRGEYSTEGFLRGWTSGNIFAIQSIQRSEEYKAAAPLTYPDDELEINWQWSFERNQLADEHRIDIFVPRIFYFMLEGQIRTAIVWTDAIPIALPKTDIVLLYREQLQKKGLFGMGKANSMALVKYRQLESLLQSFPVKKRVLDYHLLAYEKPPEELVKFFSEQPEVAPKVVTALQPDQIFGRKALAAALAN